MDSIDGFLLLFLPHAEISDCSLVWRWRGLPICSLSPQPRAGLASFPHLLVMPVFLSTQRKTLDLQPATPSSGKTLPIPVQITLRFNLSKEREAIPGSPDQALSSSSCVQPNHRSTVQKLALSRHGLLL